MGRVPPKSCFRPKSRMTLPDAVSRSISAPHSHACQRSSSVFLRTFPHPGQICEVYLGFTNTTVLPAHAALFVRFDAHGCCFSESEKRRVILHQTAARLLICSPFMEDHVRPALPLLRKVGGCGGPLLKFEPIWDVVLLLIPLNLLAFFTRDDIVS